jgi:hypothetical protein
MSDNTKNIRKLLEETLIPVPLSQEYKKKMEEALDHRKIFMNRTFSVTFAHVNMVKELADQLTASEGKFISEGEIVRRAIDLFYGATFGEPTPEPELDPTPEPV